MLGRYTLTDKIVYNENWYFYINENIINSGGYNENKIGMLMEPISILPSLYFRILNQPDEALKSFKYFFVHNRVMAGIHPKLIWAPVTAATWIKEPQIYEKTKLVSMISSSKVMCSGHFMRIWWARKLCNNIDGYGVLFNNSIESKEIALKDYMFTICMENERTPGYFTEKLIDCFNTGTIPIYWGDPEIEKVFNMDGIIVLSDSFDITSLTSELYYSKMDAIKENFEIAKNYADIKTYFAYKYPND